MTIKRRRVFSIFGIAGVGVIAVGCLLTALAFTGQQGQRYSPLNHFISELGYVGVSQWAAVFNTGLIIGGICLGIFLVGLALSLTGVLRYLFLIVGVIAGIGGTLVGVYPMNNLEAHATVAMIFFQMGGVVIALFSLYIWFSKQTIYPRWIVGIGILCVISFASFLSIVLPGGTDALAAPGGERPDVWITTVWEWAILITLLIWMFVVAFYFGRAPEGEAV